MNDYECYYRIAASYARKTMNELNAAEAEIRRLKSENEKLREALMAAGNSDISKEERDNPWHDELGRFTSGPSGISGTNKNISKSAESDMIETNKDRTVGNDVHYVGKIDRKIYSCVTEDITTDEVIITDERIQHIKSRHPNDYEQYHSYFSEIVKNPDYILKTNAPNSALVLKTITDNNKNYQLILRLHTSTDKTETKNSIITFMKISDRTLNKYLRNKEILYKNKDLTE